MENRALLPAAIHALIAAAFARLFARLEQLLLLWQSGALVPPPHTPLPRPIAAPATRRQSAARHRTRHRQRQAATTPKPPLTPVLSSAWHQNIEIPRLIRHTSLIPSPSARAPPQAKPIANTPQRRHTRTPKMFRYRN